MPLIDSRGRLFGFVNLLDAAIVLFGLVLVPIGIVTYRVFRVPPPAIAAVTPSTLPPGPDQRVRLTGTNFQPYLRVFFNRKGEALSLVSGNPDLSEGRFLVETPTSVEIKLPDLPAGTYDLRLFDEGRQVAEQIDAFVVTTGPPTTIDVVVRFVASSDLVPLVSAGDEDTYVPVGPPLPMNQPRATITSARPGANDLTATELHMFSQQERYFGLQEHGSVLEAVVAVPAIKGETGRWEYKRQPIRAGDMLKFETSRYAMFGVIHGVTEK